MLHDKFMGGNALWRIQSEHDITYVAMLWGTLV